VVHGKCDSIPATGADSPHLRHPSCASGQFDPVAPQRQWGQIAGTQTLALILEGER